VRRSVTAGAFLLSVACLAAGWPSALRAALRPQQPATLVVTVVDPSDALVPGATVGVTRVDAGLQRGTLVHATDRTGETRFEGLEPGRYSIRVEAAGVEPNDTPNIRLAVGLRRIVVKLAVARWAETVIVSAAPQEVPTRGGAFGRVLTPAEIARLPDDPEALEQAIRQLAGPGATILVDGFRRDRLPHKSEIALIRFRWTDLSAETHENSPTTVEITTRPGTDSYHGTAEIGHQNQHLAARARPSSLAHRVSGRTRSSGTGSPARTRPRTC
jgi:hypothetical protein